MPSLQLEVRMSNFSVFLAKKMYVTSLGPGQISFIIGRWLELVAIKDPNPVEFTKIVPGLATLFDKYAGPVLAIISGWLFAIMVSNPVEFKNSAWISHTI